MEIRSSRVPLSADRPAVRHYARSTATTPRLPPREPLWMRLRGWLAVPALVFVAPMIAEGRMGSCAALEGRVISMVTGTRSGPTNDLANALLAGVFGMSNGAISSMIIKERYPMLPSSLGCTAGYYRSFLNPLTPSEPARMARF